MSATPVFLSYAFRPFFLLNGFFAVVAVAVWLAALHGVGGGIVPPAMLYWHGHEMIVGFGMAAVAGFVLTAVATWTGRPPVRGALLAVLVLVWLLGRVAMLAATRLPYPAVAAADIAFPFLLGVVALREVIAARNRRNYKIGIVIVGLALLSVLYHLGVMRVLPGGDRIALYLLVHTLFLLVPGVAGRITPSFTANWLRLRGETRLPVNRPVVDTVAIAATIATGLAASLSGFVALTGVCAATAALSHAIRLSQWRGSATIAEPLLLVLHVAYLWLPVGYALTALASFGVVVPAGAALHALTIGAIANMILAVTTRVALGHTGRPLRASRTVVVAYVLLNLAAVSRVLGPLLPEEYLLLVDVAGMAWIAAFLLFAVAYWPILTGPRADAAR